MVNVGDIFKIEYGNKFDLNKMSRSDSCGISFVSRTEKNNGVAAFVQNYMNIEPYPAGLVSVALGGSVLSSFVQSQNFYTAQNVAILSPKQEMTLNEKIFYCWCIKKNRFRYSACGREANKTLKDILVPAKEEIPSWVNGFPVFDLSTIQKPAVEQPVPDLWDREWKEFRYDELFDLKKGERITKKNMINGNIPFIGSTAFANGITAYIGGKPLHQGNTITVSYNGSVGEAFYQPVPFWCSDDVNVLYPKFVMNQFSAMFFIALIKKEKFRFNYGRKWHLERMSKSTMELPVNLDGNPDWDFIENYIKSLKYSDNI